MHISVTSSKDVEVKSVSVKMGRGDLDAFFAVVSSSDQVISLVNEACGVSISAEWFHVILDRLCDLGMPERLIIDAPVTVTINFDKPAEYHEAVAIFGCGYQIDEMLNSEWPDRPLPIEHIMNHFLNGLFAAAQV